MDWPTSYRASYKYLPNQLQNCTDLFIQLKRLKFLKYKFNGVSNRTFKLSKSSTKFGIFNHFFITFDVLQSACKWLVHYLKINANWSESCHSIILTYGWPIVILLCIVYISGYMGLGEGRGLELMHNGDKRDKNLLWTFPYDTWFIF